VIVFAAALTIWDLSLGMSGVMRVLKRVHDVEEKRSTLRRVVVAVGLAVCHVSCSPSALRQTGAAAREDLVDGRVDRVVHGRQDLRLDRRRDRVGSPSPSRASGMTAISPRNAIADA
jgi:hypothetical protein